MAVALDKFVGLLRESGLIPPEELDALLAEIPAPRKADGEQLARELVKRKKLTAYQAQEVYGGRGKKLVLGNYVIQDKLGQGGMGMVLKAEHRRMERVVALKVMSKAAVESPEAVKRFHREVKAAAKLTHPNIVTAFDADEAAGTHFLVMEFVEGTDLSQLVKKNGPLPVEKALTCILGAARGLEYAHEHGIVHRDIKPANLLLDGRGHVKILDMGLARIESVGGDQAELTGTGQIMGTVDFMAPEQAMNTRKADHRADLYSLGITLWYLLTGKHAYNGDTVMERLMAHQTHPIPSLAEAGVAATPALEAVFKKMVAKTPGERYQSMSEAIAALERCKTTPGDVSPTTNLSSSEDAKLSQFLKGMGETPSRVGPSPSGGMAAQPQTLSPPAPSAAAPSTAAGLEQTINLAGPQVDTDPQTQTNLHARTATSAGGKPWHSEPRVLALGGGTLGVLLLAGLLYWLTGGSAVAPGPPDPAPNPQVAVSPAGGGSPPLAMAPFDAAKAKEHQQAWAAYLRLPVEREIALPNGVKLMMVLIPPGEFLMGSTDDERARLLAEAQGTSEPWIVDWIPSEGPQHRVRITEPFYLSKYEVTQAQWESLMGSNPSGFKEDSSHPVEQVSSEDMQPFLAKLNANFSAADMKFVLPSEAQWEYACRAGTTTIWHSGESAAGVPKFGWINANAGGKTHPVGQLQANNFGLHDMYGNVWERCADWHAMDYYAKSPVEDPTGPSTGSHYVDRGGSCLDGARVCRSASHFHGLPGTRGNNHGFRLAATINVAKLAAAVASNPAAPAGARERFALRFDGEKDEVQVPSFQFDGAPPLTLEAWITPDRVEGRYQDAVAVGDQGGQFLSLRMLDAKWWALLGDVPAQKWNNEHSSAIRPGQRCHVAATWDGQKVRLYVDGKSCTPFDGSLDASQARPRGPLSLGGNRGVGGTMDEVRISRAVVYSGPFAPPMRFEVDTNTLALYHFDEGTGDVLHDASPNKHDGKIVGAEWVERRGAERVLPGDFAVRIGEGEGIEPPQFLFPAKGPWTVEGWITPREPLPKNGGETAPIFIVQEVAFGLRHDGGQGLKWSVSGPATKPPPSQQAAEPVVAGRPVHVAIERGPEGVSFFLNGHRQGPPLAILVSSPDATFRVGKPPDRSRREVAFAGDLDELRVSSRARYSEDFVPRLRHALDADTLALYHCDEGTGDVLRDASPNKRDGKIVGAKWVRVDSAPSDGFVALFNQQNLAGWKQHPGYGGNWRVEKGVLLGSCAPQRMFAYLFSERGDYADFHLVAETRVASGTSAGISIRSPYPTRGPKIPRPLWGYLTKINADNATDRHKTGSLYFVEQDDFQKGNWVRTSPVPAGEWCKFEVIAEGERVRVIVNGVATTDFRDPTRLYQKGHVALQVFQGEQPVEFRKIEIQELPPAGESALPPAAASPVPPAAPFTEEEAKRCQQDWAKHLGVQIETTNSAGMKMVVIPPGRFMMGRSPRDAEVLAREKLPDDDLPRHQVILTKPFAIAATEVTQRQWRDVMRTNLWAGKQQVVEDPDCPATYVSWKDAVEFCKRLSIREKAEYRLPTEAEWEWACRAGSETAFSFGDDPKELPGHAWIRGNSQDRPHPVAQKRPNPWGLFDMHGNAWEWTEDVYGPFTGEAAVDPKSTAAGSQRTLRGGCFWSVPLSDYRSSTRRKWPDGLGYSESGFRPVRTLDPPPSPTQGNVP